MISTLASAAVLLGAVTLCSSAGAQGLEDVGGASWRIEQPSPPAPPAGVPEAPAPVGLGKVGDIEFYPGMPNRGVLITAGNEPTIPAGVWEYNGVAWHELSKVCGATDGRIAWAGPEEFWTISDGRAGQAIIEGDKAPPLEDDTLCRFTNAHHKGEPLEVVESFAFPAFQADSYQPMNAAACLGPDDCWFAGNALPSDSIEAGSFHLHWNGQTLTEEPYPGEGHAVEDVQPFEGRLYESVRLGELDRVEDPTPEPPVIHVINPAGVTPVFEPVRELPLYEDGEFPAALGFLHLSAGEEILWAAAGPQHTPAGSNPAQVTVARDSGGAWAQVLGPRTVGQPFAGEVPTSIAAEPQTSSAWLSLDTTEDAESPSATSYAKVARISAEGALPSEDEQNLPSEPGAGPKGAATKITCPAIHDCWLVTTQGWLFHLSTESEAHIAQDTDPAFDTLITERPKDLGLPQTPPDTLPVDDSGLLGELTTTPPVVEKTKPPVYHVTLPLISKVHTRLVHGTTLELRFHLAVKARIQLEGKRGNHVVASTAMRTFKPGNRSLLLQLNRRLWPTKLALKTHALAPLPTITEREPEGDTITTASLRSPFATGSARTGARR